MKPAIRLALILVGTALLPASAIASLQHVSFLEIPNLGNPGAEEAYLEANWSGGLDLTYLQKWDTGEQKFDQTPGIGIYSFDPAGGDAAMDVTWDLTGTAFDLAFVLIKGGNAGDGNKYYNLYSVAPDQVQDSVDPQRVILEANERKDISHITFFGVPSPPVAPATTVVPEPGTFAVWGLLAVAGLIGVKKSRSQG